MSGEMPARLRSRLQRRLIIAALVLLVLGGGLWWSTRPRIDPRLVGSWRLRTVFQGEAKEFAAILVFRNDGTCDTWYQKTLWQSDGNTLRIALADEYDALRDFWGQVRRKTPLGKWFGTPRQPWIAYLLDWQSADRFLIRAPSKWSGDQDLEFIRDDRQLRSSRATNEETR